MFYVEQSGARRRSAKARNEIERGSGVMECGDLSPLWNAAEPRWSKRKERGEQLGELFQRRSAPNHARPKGTCSREHLDRPLGGDKSPHSTRRRRAESSRTNCF